MVEFDTTNNTMKQVVPYPKGIEPNGTVICKYKDNIIVVVDSKGGIVFTFDVTNNHFTKPITIPILGENCSVIVVGDYVHIFHGRKNDDSQYLVYSLHDHKIMTFKEESCSVPMSLVAVIKGPENEFYKFGGYDWSHKKAVNSFFTGTLKDEDASKPIQWTKNPKFTLTKPLQGLGYIQYGSYIVIFGGYSTDNVDTVYVLDLRADSGWKQAALQCPITSSFTATVDSDDNIHLFTWGHDEKKHICIGAKAVIQAVNDESRDEVDEKGDDHGVFQYFCCNDTYSVHRDDLSEHDVCP